MRRGRRSRGALNQRTIRVYDLKAERVRVDSTTASGYWRVTEDGLFQFGHSKDHRPDLPQVKVMLSALDPLGMPVATQVVSGESSGRSAVCAGDRAGARQPGCQRAAVCG